MCLPLNSNHEVRVATVILLRLPPLSLFPYHRLLWIAIEGKGMHRSGSQLRVGMALFSRGCFFAPLLPSALLVATGNLSGGQWSSCSDPREGGGPLCASDSESRGGSARGAPLPPRPCAVEVHGMPVLPTPSRSPLKLPTRDKGAVGAVRATSCGAS